MTSRCSALVCNSAQTFSGGQSKTDWTRTVIMGRSPVGAAGSATLARGGNQEKILPVLDPVVGQAGLARSGRAAPADHAGIADGVVRRAEGTALERAGSTSTRG